MHWRNGRVSAIPSQRSVAILRGWDLSDRPARGKPRGSNGARIAIAWTMSRATPQELAELERQKKLEGSGDQTDPGPNAEISRESPSGKPADTTKTRTPRKPEDV
jgi:hypothetical protein